MTRIASLMIFAATASPLALAASPAAAQEAKRSYDIPAQPLPAAILRLSEQSGVVITAPGDLVDGRMSATVKGAMPARDALRKMLAGTGLGLETGRSGSLTVVPKEAPGESAGDNVSVDTTVAESAEIIVTAQKREEKLQDVPISIAVLGGKALDSSTSEGVAQALNRVPGVITAEANQGAGTQITVRGVSSTQAHFFGSPTVAYYMDSVPFGIGFSAASPDSNPYDLNRVEVLRGPQGTLYGASALSGVVRVLTHDPDLNDFELKTRGTLATTEGGDPSYRVDGAVNVPLVPGQLAARIVAGYDHRGGWINKPNREDANEGLVKNLRMKLQAKPSDALTIGLSAWLSREDYDSPNTSDQPGRNSSTVVEPITAKYDIFGLNIRYDLPFFTMTSSTSYINYKNESTVAGLLDFYSFGLPPLYTKMANENWSEEIVLNSTHGGPWRWSIGSLYRDSTDHLVQNFVGAPATILDFTSKSIAVFGEVTREFNDGQFELTGGARYFHDKQTGKDISGYSAKASFEAVTPRFVFTWHPSTSLTAYASYSEGFRSGATQDANAERNGIPPLEPDRLKNYEVGMKGSLWDGLLNIDAAIFYLDWQDVQESLTVLNQDGVVVAARVNGDSASGMGFDFGATLTPVDGLALNVGVGYNDLTMDTSVFTGSPPILLRAKGERFNYSPEWTASGSVDYNFPLGSSGLKGKFSASATYSSKQIFALYLAGPQRYFSTGKDIFTVQTSFGIESSQNWKASIFVDNLTNLKRPAIVAPTASPLWTDRRRPRTFGLQLEYGF